MLAEKKGDKSIFLYSRKNIFLFLNKNSKNRALIVNVYKNSNNNTRPLIFLFSSI